MEFVPHEEFYNDSFYEVSDLNLTDTPLDEVKQLEILRTEYVEWLYGDFYHAKFLIDFAFCLLGYTTNTLNMMVLFKIPMYNSLDLFLAVLSVSDTLQITSTFVYVIHYFAGFTWYPSYGFAVAGIVMYCLESILLCMSSSLTAASCIWRCIAITWPLRSRQLCSIYRAKITILAVFIISTVLAVPILAGYTCEFEVINGISVYNIAITELASRNDYTFEKIISGLNLLSIAVPTVLMLVATVWIGVSLYKIRMERKRILHQEASPRMDHKITAILTILLALNWLTSIPDYMDQIIYVYLHDEMDENVLQKCESVSSIINLFSVARQSVPFFIYYALGANFRKRFKEIFSKRFVSRDVITSENTCHSL